MRQFVYRRSHKQGQSLVEFALVLPLLLLLLLGMVEIGFAMAHYMQVASANREAVRLAARGRFDDTVVAARVVTAGGSRQIAPNLWEPNLRTSGSNSNTGIIITRIAIPIETGDAVQTSTYVSGTISFEDSDGEVQTRLIEPADGHVSSMSSDDLLAYLDYRRGVDEDLNDYRLANDFEINDIETYVIVETIYSHQLLTHGVPVIEDPMQLYFSSTMRILEDSRLD